MRLQQYARRLGSILKKAARRTQPHRQQPWRTFRPRMEPLEDRVNPSAIFDDLGLRPNSLYATNAQSPSASAATSVELTDEQRQAIENVVRDSTNKIWFEQNVGQFPQGVRYGFRTTFGAMLVYEDHLRLVSRQIDDAGEYRGQQIVDMHFTGANSNWNFVPGGMSQVSGNYMQADGTALRPDIFNELTIRNVYDGIDLRLYSAENGILEFDWLVARAADYQRIQIEATGQDGIIFKEDGSITLDLRFQDLDLKMPETYQVINGVKHQLTARMVAGDRDGDIRYNVAGDIVGDAPLVIDPNVAWSTYFDLNSTTFDAYLFAVAANANGVYAFGWSDDQITNGTHGPSGNNYMNVNAGFQQGTAASQNYIYRLNNSGTAITAWTSTGIARSSSTDASDLELFPDGRVLALFNDGLMQIYSANLGTRHFSGEPVGITTANAIAIVDNSSFYVSGTTSANLAGVTIATGLDTTRVGTEGVIIRYGSATTTPSANWATYIGGDGSESFTSVALTPNRTKLVFATHSFSTSGLPTLQNAVDSTRAGTTELLVGVINEQVSSTFASGFDVFSYLGGSSTEGNAADRNAAVVTASNAGFWVGGNTESNDLPGLAGAADNNYGGNSDAFVSFIPLNGSAGSGFRSTYVGGTGAGQGAGTEFIGGIAYATVSDRLLVFGTTSGSFGTTNTTPTSLFHQSTFGGGARDIFIVTVNGALTNIDYSTYIGGNRDDYLGSTGVLRGQGHVYYSPENDLTYLATTVHSQNMPTDAIGTAPNSPPGKDRVKETNSDSADTHIIFAFNVNIFDYGDAPASYEGGSPAGEALSFAIRIGATIDAEFTALAGAAAAGDDSNNTGAADDEDGIASLPTLRVGDPSYTVQVSVLNNTGASRTLQGWIDFNNNGIFESTERATATVSTSASQQNVNLTWSGIPTLTAGQNYLRLRFSENVLSDVGATAIDERSIGVNPTGHGEVEDYSLNIQPAPTLSVNNVTVTEGTDPFAVFTVSLNAASGAAISFTLALANGSALGGGTDYGTGGAGNLQVSTDGGTTWVDAASATLPAGTTSLLVRTPITDDLTSEPTENFTLTATVTAGTTNNANATGTGTILDNDVAVANLSLTKSVSLVGDNDGSGSITAGDTIRFTIIVSNAGPNAATGVSVGDALPTGYTGAININNGGTFSGGIVSWTGLTVANGGSVTLSFDTTVNSSGNYTNVAEITGSDLPDPNSNPDPTPDNDPPTEDDEASSTPSVTPTANLSLTKSVSLFADNDGSGSISAGDTILFSIIVSNAGPNTATGVSVGDLLPTGYTGATNINNGGTFSGGIVSWSGLTVANGGSVTLTFRTIVNATGNYTNVAEITGSDAFDPNSNPDPTPDNDPPTQDDEASVTPVVTPVANLSLTKSVSLIGDNDGSGSISAGDTIRFTIIVNNAGPNAATGVSVGDALPTGYTGASNINNGGTFSGGIVSWTGLTVANGGSVSLSFDTTVNGTGNYTNVAEITGSNAFDPNSNPDPTPDNDPPTQDDEASITPVVTPVANLSLTKSVSLFADNDGSGSISAGDTILFSIIVSNAGPNTATGVNVGDLLPSGYTGATNINNGGTFSGGIVSWSGLTIANGGSVTLTFRTTVNATGNYTNVAEITGSDAFDPNSNPDPTPDNDPPTQDDEASVTPVVTPVANLSLTKSVILVTDNDGSGGGNITPGDVIRFTIIMSNAGPNTATGVSVGDLLPSGYTGATNINNGGTFSGGIVSWTGLTVANGGSVTLTFDTTVNATGNHTNVAEITGSNAFDPNSSPDPTPDNDPPGQDDEASVVPSITPVSNLNLSKSVDNGTPLVGSNVVFTITVNNTGPSAAAGVVIRDLLPNGVSFVTAFSLNGSYSNITGNWTLANPIVSGGSATLQITATVLAAGNYTNYAQVFASSSFDPNSTPGNGSTTEDDDDSVTLVPIVNQPPDGPITFTVDPNSPGLLTTTPDTYIARGCGPLTFIVGGVNDPDPGDNAAGFTFQFDWNNDGVIDAASGPGQSGVTFDYTTVFHQGEFTPRVRAVDQNGNAGSWTTLDLPNVSVPAAALFTDEFGAVNLTINGTDLPDAISVNAYNYQNVTVKLNGVNYGPFTLSPNGHIIIATCDAPDLINLSGYVPYEVHGGYGNDTIYGGSSHDVIYGDEGNDYITGGIGNDVIIGGMGKDIIQGGNDADILLGGMVDKSVYDFAALRTVSDAWFANPPSSPPPASLFALRDATVDPNTTTLEKDTLTGGLGKDAFLYRNSGTGADAVADYKTAEKDYLLALIS